MRAVAIVLALALRRLLRAGPHCSHQHHLQTPAACAVSCKTSGARTRRDYHLAKNLADKDLTVTIADSYHVKPLTFRTARSCRSSTSGGSTRVRVARQRLRRQGDTRFDNNSKKPATPRPSSAPPKSDAFYSS